MRRFVSDHAGLVQRVGAIELKQLETDKRIDTVFDALDRGKPTQTEIAKFNPFTTRDANEIAKLLAMVR